MAYGLIPVDADPRAEAQMRAAMKATGQNFRKLEASLTAGLTATRTFTELDGTVNTVTIANGIITAWTQV